MFTGTGFAQPIIGRPLMAAMSGSRIVPIGSMCTMRVERDAAEQSRRGVAKAIGGPRVRRLVNREGHEHDGEADDGEK